MLLLLLTAVLGPATCMAVFTHEPQADYEERLNQFVLDTLAKPGCGLYTELLREAD